MEKKKFKKHCNRHKHKWILYKEYGKVVMQKCEISTCNRISYPNKNLYKRSSRGCFGAIQ